MLLDGIYIYIWHLLETYDCVLIGNKSVSNSRYTLSASASCVEQYEQNLVPGGGDIVLQLRGAEAQS